MFQASGMKNPNHNARIEKSDGKEMQDLIRFMDRNPKPIQYAQEQRFNT